MIVLSVSNHLNDGALPSKRRYHWWAYNEDGFLLSRGSSAVLFVAERTDSDSRNLVSELGWICPLWSPPDQLGFRNEASAQWVDPTFEEGRQKENKRKRWIQEKFIYEIPTFWQYFPFVYTLPIAWENMESCPSMCLDHTVTNKIDLSSTNRLLG